MYVPNNYTTKDFQSQIGAFMACKVHYFYPQMSNYLHEKGITYEAYVTGVSLGDISADQFMILAISRMWNISISIISSAFNAIWNLYYESKGPNIVIIGNGREFGNKRQSHHYSPTEKTLPSAKKLGHDIDNIDVKYIQTRVAGEKVGTETFMIREWEELLKKHYEVGKQIKQLKEKLAVYEEQYEVIGNCLCELEHDKDLLNCFRLHKEQRKQGFQQMDSGRIPQIWPEIPTVENPSKKRKISHVKEDLPEVVVEEGTGQVVLVEVHGEFMEETPAPLPTVAPTSEPTTTVAAALATAATPTPVPTAAAALTATATPTSTSTTSTVALTPRASSVKVKSGRCSREATGPVPECDQDPSQVYCPHCLKHFKWEKGLKEHLRDRCGKTQKMFQCGVCQKEFHHEESLLDHIGIFHTGVKRHKCEYVQKRISTEKTWKHISMKCTRNNYRNNDGFWIMLCVTQQKLYALDLCHGVCFLKISWIHT